VAGFVYFVRVAVKLTDVEKIKFNVIPEILEELNRLRSDNEYLLEKIIELESKIENIENKRKEKND